MTVKYLIQQTTFNIDISRWRDKDSPVTKEEVKDFVEANPFLRTWARRKENKAYPRHLKVYCDIVGLSPQQLLNLKSQYGSTTAEELLETVQEALTEEYGVEYKGRIFGISQVWNMTTAVKSFYTYNGKSLAKGRATYHYRKVHPKAKYTKEDLIKFVDGQAIQLQAWVAVLSSVPFRIETFEKLDWYHVREALDESIKLPHVKVEPELLKKSLMELNLEQHGFLHSWAGRKLREWRKEWERITGKKIDLAHPETLNQPLWIQTKGKDKGKRISKHGIERHFRKRSRSFGKRIAPHSFRSFFKSNVNCSEDEKAVFMAQTGRHNRAYNMELIERLREIFKEATKRLNPLFTDKFIESKKVLEGKFKSKLEAEEIEWLSEKMSLGLMKMEEQLEEMKDKFLASFLSNVGVQLEEKRRIQAREKEQEEKRKLRPEEEFPYTKESWKGIYKESDKS